MAQNISLWGANYTAVPGLKVPKTGGGEAAYWDTTDTTAQTDHVNAGETFRDAQGVLQTGTQVIQHYYTGSGAPPASLGENGDIYLQTT